MDVFLTLICSAKKAQDLIAAGCTTLAQLREEPRYQNMISPTIRLDLTFKDRLDKKIKRVEIEAIAVYLYLSMSLLAMSLPAAC